MIPGTLLTIALFGMGMTWRAAIRLGVLSHMIGPPGKDPTKNQLYIGRGIELTSWSAVVLIAAWVAGYWT